MDVNGLVTEHGTWMLRLAYLLTGDRATADDIYQDTLVKVVARPWSVGAARNRKAYLRKMLVNCHIDAARRRSATFEILADPRSGPLAVADSSPILEVELHQEMWEAISRLSPPLRTALVLRYYEDLDDHEIASVVGWSRSTVRSNVSRALTELRKSWARSDKDEVPR